MDSGSDNFLLIVLAFVAGFILLQLHRVLGKKTGYDGSDEKDENQAYGRRSTNHRDQAEETDNVVTLDGDHYEQRPERDYHVGVKPDSPFYEPLKQIRQYDRDFSLSNFMDGAEQAYGMILNAFWSGDTGTLRSMLSKDVYTQFASAIDNMKSQNRHFDNTLNDVEKIDVEDVTLTGSMAELSMKFTSHMTLVTKDEEDRIIEGDATEPVSVTDIWTFCRDVKSSDPNWTLIATRNA